MTSDRPDRKALGYQTAVKRLSAVLALSLTLNWLSAFLVFPSKFGLKPNKPSAPESVHNLKRKIAFLGCPLRITSDKSFVFPGVDPLPVSSRHFNLRGVLLRKYKVRSAAVNFARNGPRLVGYLHLVRTHGLWNALTTTNVEEV